mgnify:CR=1 FL=1
MEDSSMQSQAGFEEEVFVIPGLDHSCIDGKWLIDEQWGDGQLLILPDNKYKRPLRQVIASELLALRKQNDT